MKKSKKPKSPNEDKKPKRNYGSSMGNKVESREQRRYGKK
jgi:hypothetical protein